MLKKIACLLIALSCTASLASCGGGGAEKAVEGLLDSAFELNLKEISKYSIEAEDMEEEFDGKIPENIDQLVDYFADEEELVKENAKTIKKVANAAHKKVKDSVKYKVTGSEEDDDVTICTVEITMPDSESIMSAVQEAAKDIDITEYMGMDEEDLEDSKVVDKLADQVLDAIKKLKFEDTTTFEVGIAMKEEDGKWVVSPEDCDVEEIVKEMSSFAGFANMIG